MAGNARILEQLQTIRDHQITILQSHKNIFERAQGLKNKQALSDEEFDLATIEFLEARIKLAEAEIALLKEQS